MFNGMQLPKAAYLRLETFGLGRLTGCMLVHQVGWTVCENDAISDLLLGSRKVLLPLSSITCLAGRCLP